MTPKKLLLAAPRGFCAGVTMAIECLDRALARYGTPIYVYHQIVHNKFLVGRYESRGVVFVDSLSEVPPGSRVLFSAHGVSPSIRQEAETNSLQVIDATCPLVTKVHAEAKRFAEDERLIFFIGHAQHDEAVGVIGEVPDGITTVESIEDVSNLPQTMNSGQRAAYLTQTTLGVDETQSIIEALRQRFPEIKGPRQSDICYATQNRQRAVQVLSQESDITIVIGSLNSSNSQRLREVASANEKPAYLVDGPSEINLDWFEGVSTILLTAGASASEELVQDCVEWLCQRIDLEVEERVLETETVRFQLPAEVR